MKQSSSTKSTLKPLQKGQFMNTRLKTTIYSPNCVKTEETPSTKFSELQSSKLGIKKFSNFNDFVWTCDDLQRDVNEASSVIEKKIIEGQNSIDLENLLKRKIRNHDYKKGLEKIEERLKLKKEEKYSKEFKNLQSIVSKDYLPDTDYSIGPGEVTSQQAVEFLYENRRKFGKHFIHSPSSTYKKSIRPKLKDIKINPHETIFEDLKYDTSVLKPSIHRSSVPNIYKGSESPKDLKPNFTDNKAKLPSLSLASILASRAKADANRFFADRKLINARLETRKKSTIF
jgi:hypothetical protein